MIHVEDADGGAVRLVTIDRQERRNAVDHEALEGLRDALASTVPATAGGSIRALVLTGAGGHFCAGADLSGVEDQAFVALLHEVLEALRTAPYPTVAAASGAALGAGTQLAVACDLRLAAPTTTFGVPAAKLGLMVDGWTVHRLASMVGQGTARQILLAADTLDGSRAHGLGLVQRLADDEGDGEGVRAAALEWAGAIAALAPLTIAGHKVGCNDAEDLDRGSAGYLEAFRRAWASADLQEGLAAFRERRPPAFEGR